MASLPPFARLARSVVLLPLLLPLAQGCGSDNAGGGPSVSASEVGTYEKFLQRAAELGCAAQAECCTTAGAEPNEDCAEDVLKAGFGQGFDTRGNYSPDGAAACLSASSTTAAYCPTSAPVVDAPRVYGPDPCRSVFRGPNFDKVPLYGECQLSSDCISAGDNARTECRAGTDPGDSRVRCRALVTSYPGEPCGEGIGTAEGKTFQCISTSRCVDQVCVALPGAGEPCSKEGALCAPGSTCVQKGAERICTAPGQKGDSCSQGVGCGANLFCDGVVCKARGKAGDACGSGSSGIYGNDCEPSLYCDGVVCKAYGKAGDACKSGQTCRSGSCSNKGRCDALSGSGPGSLAPYCK